MSKLKNLIKNLANSRFENQVALNTKKIVGSTTISLLDVGAANGSHDRWSAFRKHVDYFGVEPDSRSTASVLNSDLESSFHSQSLVTKALWHSPGQITLNLCRKPMVSSIYEPNRPFADLFQDPERTDIVDKITLDCETIDMIADQVSKNFDVIKLDVQGAELDVLRGATFALKSALAVEIEVEFCEIYIGQPLFDQVFSFLRTHGLEFIDFTYIYRWSPDQFNGLGQATFSDALFMPSPEVVADSQDSEKISKFAMICAVYERGDLLLRLGNRVSKNVPQLGGLAKEIVALGDIISSRNARTQRQLDRATKIIRLFHPRVRSQLLH